MKRPNPIAARAGHLAAVRLFASGNRQIAVRLVQINFDEHCLGDWCFGAVRDQVQAAVEQALREAKPKKRKASK